MEDSVKTTIREEIAPLVMNGDMTLFIGAGFSQETKNISGGKIPSTNGLINMILERVGFTEDEGNYPSLKDAFSLGESEIDDFHNFLFNIFSCKEINQWQSLIFKHWWSAVFTTNIDTVIEKAIEFNKSNNIPQPDYITYNYSDAFPSDPTLLTPPIIKLHGSIDKPEAGYIFNNAQYSSHIIQSPDWLRTAALRLYRTPCLLLAFNFDESDIEVELEKRKRWDVLNDQKNPIWIVRRHFTKLDTVNLSNRGITPITADAEIFCTYLDSCLTTLSPTKYIKRKYPHLRDLGAANNSISYLASEFEHIPTEIRRRSNSRLVFSNFYNGDSPDWYYIAKEVPARFDYLTDLKTLYREIINQPDGGKVKGLIVHGPTASGKTTLCRLLLKDLSETESTIYEFSSQQGLDIQKTFTALKEAKGDIVLYFDNSSDQFYAIQELIEQFIDGRPQGNLILIFSERSLTWKRNRHHIPYFNDDKNCATLPIPPLTKDNAEQLLRGLINVGMSGNILNQRTESEAISLICDKEKGYKGDLLATLCDVVTGHSFYKYIKDDYDEIDTEEAKNIYTLLSIVTSSNLSLPIRYIAEIFNLTIRSTIDTLANKLEGKLYWKSNKEIISTRHPVIATNFLQQSDNFDTKRDLIISLMTCLSNKFDLSNIRTHPSAFRIYKKIISHQFLRDIVFRENRHIIEDIYYYCQRLFPNDGMYWIQYGRYLHSCKKYDDAIHCYRKGTSIYDSAHGRHALAHCLLQRFIQSNCTTLSDYEEGLSMFRTEIAAIGSSDPYPHTTLAACLIKIYQILPKDYVMDILRETINDGLKYHRLNDSFQRVIKQYHTEINTQI